MKKCLLVFFVIAFALMLSACGSSNEQATGTETKAVDKDTLTVIISADPGSLDPHDSTGIPHLQVTRQIYETLFVRDSDFKLQPWLAESYEYENDTTLVIHLRKGVKFTNGDELKASDVLFSLKRMRDDNTAAATPLAPLDLDKSTVVDDYTVKLVTTTPYPMLIAVLENPISTIISEKVYKENGGNFYDAGCVGTGPYKLVSYESGSKVTLVANENYWVTDQPKIKNAVFKIISDSSSRAIEAESGGADIVYDIGANDVERLSSMDNLQLVSDLGMQTQMFTMNVTFKPFDDIRVRQAIFYALDRSELVAMACGDFGEVATGLLNPGVDGKIDLTDKFVPTDVEKAKALLAEAGYPNGIDVELVSPNHDKIRMDFCEGAQAQLAKAGINVKIKYVEYNDWVAQMNNAEVAFGQWGMTAMTGEAGRVLQRFLAEFPDSKVYSWYDDDYAKVCNKALQTIDATKRNELFAECQKKVMDAYVCYPIWSNEINAAVQNYVKGFELQRSYSHHYLQTVNFE